MSTMKLSLILIGQRAAAPAMAQHGGINCKHVLAALQARYAAQGRLSFWRSPGAARRQHRRLLTGDQLYITLRPRVRRFSKPELNRER